VVALDINGNRELPAVLECLEYLMRPGDDVQLDGVDWKLPRLIIVKNKSLYMHLKKRENE